MKKGIDISNLNPAIKPADNFYNYACGGWQQKHPLKPEYARYGTFDLLRENALEQLKDLIIGLKDDPASKEKGTLAQKISDLYEMGMDEKRLNSEKGSPLLPYLKRVEEMKEEDFWPMVSELHTSMCSTFFGSGVSTDARNSDYYAMHLGEGGLGLGDRDYYLEENDTHRKIMDAYKEYLVKIALLAGYEQAEAERMRDTVLETEHQFAIHKMTREEKRDPIARYNPMTFDELCDKYDKIDWHSYFTNIGVKDLKRAIVLSPKFYEFLNSYLSKLSLRQKKDLMIMDIISSSTGVLSDDFQQASFELYDRVMSGTEEMEPRWKRAMRIPNSMFGEAVGQLYVEKYFPRENKEKMLDLVEHLREALGQHIQSLSWMSSATKERALDKLRSMKVKIGYPDKIKDYSEIKIDPSLSYMENVRRASEWYIADNYKKLDTKVDKEEWHMTPQTVNAYYSPVSNEICFPAGILHPPYFDMEADDAVNYGAIGVVIGHEMTHGFDDSGRKFDKHGNLTDWWTSEDAENFNQQADRLADQFDNVEVAPGVKCNGRFTLGENIADQGGLRVAMTAYKNSTNGSDEVSESPDGFTPAQRFYLSYANVWADNIRDEEILSRTKSDPHSLGRNRVNVTLPNIDEFIEAFSIKEGDGMYRDPDQRIVIW